MTDALKLAAAAASVISTLLVIAGLVVKFVLLPYLRDHLEKPLHEAHHAVTVNEHKSEDPTLPDKIDTLTHEVRSVGAQVTALVAWKNEHNRLTDEVLAQGRDHDQRIARLERGA